MKQETKELITKRAEVKQRELKPEDFTHIELMYIDRLLKGAFIIGVILGFFASGFILLLV